MASECDLEQARRFPTPVFVVGIGRSGTSALLKSLGKHREFVDSRVFGEAPFIDQFAQFLVTYEGRESPKDYNLASYKVPVSERYAIMNDMIFRLHAAAADQDQAKRAQYWAAKTSIRQQTYEKFRQIFGPFKVLYILRNGIEVVHSARHFDGFKAVDFAGLCRRWKGNIASNAFLERSDNCAVIRHQDLVADPSKVLGQAFSSLGIHDDPGPAEFLSQNMFNSSFTSGSESGDNVTELQKRLADAWGQWSKEERDFFTTECRDEMSRFGFAIPGLLENEDVKQPSVAAANRARAARARSPKCYSPIVKFEDTAEAAGAVRISATAIADRALSSQKEIRIEIENRVGFATANYCIHPSPGTGLMYAEVPKVACSTIKYLIQSLELESKGETVREFDRPIIHNRRLSPLPAIRMMSDEEFEQTFFGKNYFRFSFVRNPFERVLSCYLSKITKPKMPQRKKVLALYHNISEDEAAKLDQNLSLADFLETVVKQSIRDMDIHWRPQVDQLLLGIIEYDFIGRYEQLTDGLGYIKARYFPGSAIEVPGSTNSTSASSRIEEFYDERCVELVQKIYARDFAILGYDPKFPRGSESAAQPAAA